jgi:hypothetical protein
MRHAGLGTQQGIHTIIAASYVNAAERTSAEGLVTDVGIFYFTANDIGKVVFQEDNSTYWILNSITPISWVQIAIGASFVLADTAAEDVVAGSGTIGISPKAAHADHQHSHGDQTDPTLHATATGTAAGFMPVSAVLKLDGIESGATNSPLSDLDPQAVSKSAADSGISVEAARIDHKHDIETAVAVSIGTANAEGGSSSLSRSDHVHAHGAQTDSTLHAIATVSAAGFMDPAELVKLNGIESGATRSPLTSVNPLDVSKTAAVVGVSLEAARSDHKHSVATAAAVDVGVTNTEGTSDSLARADHGHAVPFSAVQSALSSASASVSINSQRVTNLANPVGAQDAVTKSYADAMAAGLDLKDSVMALSLDTVLSLSGLATVVDDFPLNTDGQRVLLAGLSNAVDRGIYLVHAGAWTRSEDMATGSDAAGNFCFIEHGTQFNSSGWICNSPVGSSIVGTDSLSFTQFSGAGQIDAGAALSKTGNRLDVEVSADGSIVVTADALQVGVLATDSQHGDRGGGSLHEVATEGTPGFMAAAQVTKLAGVAPGATNTPLSAATPTAVDVAAGDAGVAGTAARGDHKHSITVAAPVGLAFGGSNVIGTSDAVPRADHQHAVPAFTSALLVAAYAAAWAVTDWYIDQTTGNDTNDGVTISTPIKTGAELQRRLGSFALWSSSVTIHVGANGMSDPLVLRGTLETMGTHLDVVGTPTQIADAGTVLTLTDIDHPNAKAPQITTSLVADWTAYQWKRLRVPSGTHVDTVTWVAKANPAGAGVSTARVSKFVRLNPASLTSNFITGGSAIAVGDALVVESLPTIPSISIDVTGVIDTSNTPFLARRLYLLRDVSCQLIEIRSPVQPTSNYRNVFGCRINVLNSDLAPQVSNLSVASVVGCSFYFLPNSAVLQFSNNAYASLFGEGGGAASNVYFAQSAFLQWVLFQGVAVSGYELVQLYGADIQVFDSPSTTTDAFKFGGGSCQGLSGTGNAGYGIGMPNNIMFRYRGVTNLQGALGNARLSAAPVVVLTLPQALQPSDYAQKGTATLVNGTATVTVPWWDPTTQKLELSYNTRIGTAMGVQAPVASRTNTSFVIDALLATDSSTIDWEIGPLGRNIFIVTV